MNIHMYPHPILLEDLTHIETRPDEVVPISKRFLNLCIKVKAIGLAANQAGLRMNMILVGVSGHNRRIPPVFYFMLNPKIIEQKGKPKWGVEGCRSLPAHRKFRVKRSPIVKTEFMDLKGSIVRRTFRGFNARVFLHEFDHLHGLNLPETGVEVPRDGEEVDGG